MEVVEFHAAAAAGAAARDVRAILRDDEDVEAGERLRVGGEGAVGCGDQDAAHLVGEAGANLHDARIGGARRAIGTQQQVELGCDVRRRPPARARDRGPAAARSRKPVTGSFAGPLAISAAVRAARSRRSAERSSV